MAVLMTNAPLPMATLAYEICLKIGTRSVHVGSLCEVSQDTPNYNCKSLRIMTCQTRMIAILLFMVKPRLIAMFSFFDACRLF